MPYLTSASHFDSQIESFSKFSPHQHRQLAQRKPWKRKKPKCLSLSLSLSLLDIKDDESMFENTVMMIDYFRLSNDPSVTSVTCFSSMPRISFTERLIDNQPARSGRANCFDRLPLPGGIRRCRRLPRWRLGHSIIFHPFVMEFAPARGCPRRRREAGRKQVAELYTIGQYQP